MAALIYTGRLAWYRVGVPHSPHRLFWHAVKPWALVLLLASRLYAQQTGPGTALQFNGATQYVSIATTGSLSGTFTVELWAKLNAPTNTLGLAGSRSPGEFSFDAKFMGANLIHGDIGNGSDWLSISADAAVLYSTSRWYHVAYAVTPTNYSIYVGADLVATGSYPSDTPVLYDPTHQLNIGWTGFPGLEYFAGEIDEVRIWNTARTQAEIGFNYYRRLTGSEPGLMGYWRFDEGTGTTTADASGHGFTATLVNGPAWVGSTAPIGVNAGAPLSDSAAYTFSTLAGFAGAGSSDGVGPEAQFFAPSDVAVDGSGNCYVADTGNHIIRKISPAGVTTTIAGFPGSPGAADGSNGVARFNAPRSITVDGLGNLFVADSDNDTIRMLTPIGTNWVVTTIAGQVRVQGGADGTNGTAQFRQPMGVATDTNGNLYVADSKNFTIRKVSPSGSNWVTTTIAGRALMNGTNDTKPALFMYPKAIAADDSGNLYVADAGDHAVRKLTPQGGSWVLKTIAGGPNSNGTNDGLNSLAQFSAPQGIAVDSSGNLYVSDASDNNTIRKVAPQGKNWVVTTLAGMAHTSGSANGTGSDARFDDPSGVAVDSAGDLRVADTLNNAIRKVTSAGVVQSVAGVLGHVGSADGLGANSRFNMPYGVAVDSAGTIYVADSQNYVIREITSAGLASTLAGSAGNPGTNDGVGSNARFFQPEGIALDGAGNIYVTDNSAVREITPAGVVSTIAGVPGSIGISNAVGSAALFFGPEGLTVDAAGNVFVADTFNNLIRRIESGPNHVVTTIAGKFGFFPVNSADGTNDVARFNDPRDIAIDRAGILYVTDGNNDTIRKITPSGTNWVVTTIAGTAGISVGNDGVNGAASFIDPYGIAVDNAGNLYVGDEQNDTIRMIIPSGTNWVVRTIGGLAGQYGSADGSGTNAFFGLPRGVAVDESGHIYIADSFNSTIRFGMFAEHVAAYLPSVTIPTATNQLVVTLLPPEAQGQWRFPWELGWRDSGVPATNLTAGNYPVEFRAVPGYVAVPQNLTSVHVASNGPTIIVTNVYYPTIAASDTNSASGSLAVHLDPVPPPAGAGWRFLGGAPPYLPSDYSTNLLAGTYLLEFAPVAGYATPPDESIPVYPGQPTHISVAYFPSAAKPAEMLFPFAVPTNEISDLENYPFGFDGQLQSDAGYGSGVAVQANVVLTAAHLVFDDHTKSYVSEVYWYFQREAGVIEPEPVPARGWFVLSGYAAQRTNDLKTSSSGPDKSSPQSRNFDVAALYFPAPMADGGYGGYLPSDATPNTWLASTSLKMLMGYPVDGSSFGDTNIMAGAMYQTDPQPYPLSLATDPVDDQQVYIAPWVLSYPGNSGGPMYMQYNGYYYPAGVYLGTLYSSGIPYGSAIHGIDSNVVNMIILAQSQGDAGTNNTGGGVITIIPNQSVSASHPGYMQWRLGPPSALRAGAGWRLSGDTAYSGTTNYTRAILSTNAVVVQFKPIPGWILPADQSVSVSPDQITPYNAFYTVVSPALTADPVLGIGITGTTGTTYRIERRTSLTSGNWQPVTTNTIIITGFNPLLPSPSANQTATFYRAVWLP